MNRSYNADDKLKVPMMNINTELEECDVSSSTDEKTKKLLRKKRVLELFNQKSTETCHEESNVISSVSNNIKENADNQINSENRKFFNVVYGKKSTKKHKTWEGDGLLLVENQSVTLKDTEGKILGKTLLKSTSITEGYSFSVGNFLIEVLEKVSLNDISNNSNKKSETETLEPPTKRIKQQFIPLRLSGSNVNNKLKLNTLSIMKDRSINLNSGESSKQSEVIDQNKKSDDKVMKVLSLFEKKDVDNVSESIKINKNVNAERILNQNEDCTSNTDNDTNISQKIIYNVVYGKITAKKHKTYDEDGLLEVENKSAILKDMKGNIIGRSSIKPGTVFEGAKLSVGNKEVEVLDKFSSEKVTTELPKLLPKIGFSKPTKKINSQQFISLRDTGKNKFLDFDPLIMPPVKKEIEWDEDETEIQEVSVDPCLASVLRPHQRVGLVFLYKCIMGINKQSCEGVILADEMGLGKTLQCISLIWTLLKQGPFGKPVLKRVLIVAPSSLCGNWKKEFIHWLGSHRIAPYVVNEKNKPKDFAKFPRANVMIISYDMLVRNFDDVNKFNFDMVICDEGHRLKNCETKALKMLNQLRTRKRIILTGTPVQNDLQELYTLADFVNPGIFEDRAQFKKYYENPIVASQLPEASEESIEIGLQRARELHESTKLFTLRRTNDLINKYLPQKHELVIFCRFTKIQETLYEAATNDWLNRSTLPIGGTPFPLAVINNLKKICNHPTLIQNEKELNENKSIRNILTGLNPMNMCEQSGKLLVLRALMRNLRSTTEKLVLVSYFTQTLDILEKVCDRENLQFCRLDGTTSSSSRMQIVENFNANVNKECRVFLLSAKAGGVGLNLPAASRLVLFDSDWNPANDSQAMARIWREGQKRTVYIYRFLTTGSIEEKIYQRQISKTGLSEAVVDSNHISSMKLSLTELKDLFTLVKDSNSVTHDLMECSCDIDSNEFKENIEHKVEEDLRHYQLNLNDNEDTQHLTINQLLRWDHYKSPINEELLKSSVYIIMVAKCVQSDLLPQHFKKKFLHII